MSHMPQCSWRGCTPVHSYSSRPNLIHLCWSSIHPPSSHPPAGDGAARASCSLVKAAKSTGDRVRPRPLHLSKAIRVGTVTAARLSRGYRLQTFPGDEAGPRSSQEVSESALEPGLEQSPGSASGQWVQGKPAVTRPFLCSTSRHPSAADILTEHWAPESWANRDCSEPASLPHMNKLSGANALKEAAHLLNLSMAPDTERTRESIISCSFILKIAELFLPGTFYKYATSSRGNFSSNILTKLWITEKPVS